jgi:hypothetical protein
VSDLETPMSLAVASLIVAAMTGMAIMTSASSKATDCLLRRRLPCSGGADQQDMVADQCNG